MCSGREDDGTCQAKPLLRRGEGPAMSRELNAGKPTQKAPPGLTDCHFRCRWDSVIGQRATSNSRRGSRCSDIARTPETCFLRLPIVSKDTRTAWFSTGVQLVQSAKSGANPESGAAAPCIELPAFLSGSDTRRSTLARLLPSGRDISAGRKGPGPLRNPLAVSPDSGWNGVRAPHVIATDLSALIG